MVVCNRCVISDKFPGSQIDDSGLCITCRRTAPMSVLREARKTLEQRMRKHVGELLQKGIDADYDVIVAYSGGKDSSYTLKYLVEDLKLRCLAVTINNGFISDRARENCEVFTTDLGCDWLYFTPSSKFMKEVYTVALEKKSAPAAIKRSSEICSGCINLINSIMIKLAIEKNIPLVAGGYIGGQVPKDGAAIDLSLLKLEADIVRNKTLSNYFKLSFSQYYLVNKKSLQNFSWEKLTVINPMLGLEISEEDIITKISLHGWLKPSDTGANSSNCLLNDYGIYKHAEKYGFNPYMQEIAEQVRHGLMSRDEGLKKVNEIPDYKDVKHLEKKLFS